MMNAKAKKRDKYLRIRYGITLKAYTEQLEKQEYCCWICKKHESKFRSSLAVDHNHKTGQPRGLLCFYCNKRVVGRATLESASKVYAYMLYFETENRWTDWKNPTNRSKNTKGK